jgi:hypothetical protein
MYTRLDGRRPQATKDALDQTSSASLELSADRASDAVTRLIDLIEIRPLAMMDSTQLPLPREDMKAALKFIWRTTSDRKMCDRSRHRSSGWPTFRTPWEKRPSSQ